MLAFHNLNEQPYVCLWPRKLSHWSRIRLLSLPSPVSLSTRYTLRGQARTLFSVQYLLLRAWSRQHAGLWARVTGHFTVTRKDKLPNCLGKALAQLYSSTSGLTQMCLLVRLLIVLGVFPVWCLSTRLVLTHYSCKTLLGMLTGSPPLREVLLPFFSCW